MWMNKFKRRRDKSIKTPTSFNYFVLARAKNSFACEKKYKDVFRIP